MKRSSFLLTLIAVTVLLSVMDASAQTRGSKLERIKLYTKFYQDNCKPSPLKPSPLCTAQCQDLYDFLRREGVDVGGPCRPH
jgi:hypothetical protein